MLRFFPANEAADLSPPQTHFRFPIQLGLMAVRSEITHWRSSGKEMEVWVAAGHLSDVSILRCRQRAISLCFWASVLAGAVDQLLVLAESI
jgi:hypothetical protein